MTQTFKASQEIKSSALEKCFRKKVTIVGSITMQKTSYIFLAIAYRAIKLSADCYLYPEGS